MTDWRAVMRDDHDVAISPERAQEIRRAVMAAAQHLLPSRVVWPWKLALAAAALMVLAGGAGDVAQIGSPPTVPSAPTAPSERRQLQFATPGGTRIIWELNPNFTLMETLP
jgi:hypothetical protein